MAWAAFLVAYDWASLSPLKLVQVSPAYDDRLAAEHVTETAQNDDAILSQQQRMRTAYPKAIIAVSTKEIN